MLTNVAVCVVKHLKAWVIYLQAVGQSLKHSIWRGTIRLSKSCFLRCLKPHQYSQAQPKPMYENDRVIAYWDLQLFADTTHVKANRIDARIIDKEKKGSQAT